MTIDNNEMLDMLKELKRNKPILSHITNKEDLTFEDKMKLSLCRHFVRYMNERRITLTELSKELNLPKSRVSEIINYKLTKYSLEKLISNIQKLAVISPKTREYINFVCEAFEVPAMNVRDTKKLTKQIKDIQQHGADSTFLHAQ